MKLLEHTGIAISYLDSKRSSNSIAQIKNERFIVYVKPENSHGNKGIVLQQLMEASREENLPGIMLSSYTQAINQQENRKGSLFAHSTKSIMLNMKGNDYLLNCFMYIHQNPLLAGIVDRIEDWEYSSYPDYIGKRNGSLINLNLGLDVLNIDKEDIEIITNQLLIDKTDEDFL